MSMKKEKSNVPCYLRTHRRVWGLTVKELAALIGLQSASHMSRIEHSKRAPRVEVALACQVIFGIPPSAMFPHVYTLVEDRVMWNIGQLHLALEKTTSLSGLRKRELCELALKRATSKPIPLEGI
jgi:transcriptional regulator with XRE-family HTH domain